MSQIDVVFWGTRSYDVRTTAFVDKKDYDVAFEQVGPLARDIYSYLYDIGYEFEVDDMSPTEEVITDMDLFYES